MPESSREGTPLGPHSSVHYGEVENAAGLYVAGIEPGLCVRLTGCVLVEVRMQETSNQIGDVGAGVSDIPLSSPPKQLNLISVFVI